MKKIFLFFFFFLSLQSLASVHHLIFIHGIASGPGTFDYMDEGLLKKLGDEFPLRAHKKYMFSYPTGRDQYDVNDFTAMLDTYLKEELELSENDKVSVIAHSQGGLVTFNWIRAALRKKLSQHSYEIVKNRIEHIITLGTPFQGTQIAKVPLYLRKVKDFIFGKKELRDMLFGSDFLVGLRNDFFFDQKLRDYIHSVKVLNVVGNFRLANTGSLSFYLQDDLAVPVTSAHLNYYYYLERERPDPFSSNRSIKYLDFELGEQAFFTRPHMDFLRKQGLSGAEIECVEYVCDNDVFWKVFQFLSEQSNKSDIDGRSSSFLVHVRLNFLKTSKYKMSDNSKNYKLSLSEIDGHGEFGGGHVFYTRFMKSKDPKYKSSADFYLAGKIRDGSKAKGLLEISIRGGYMIRKVPINLERSKATIVELEAWGIKDYLP